MDIMQLERYAGGVPSLPESKQKVWNLIGQGKMVMDQRLQGHALKLQQITNGYETKDYAGVTAAMKEYRSTFSLMEGDRKVFTVYLDEAKKRCMKVENEYSPETNPVYKGMAARELELRTAANKAITDANTKTAELAAYRSHMITQLQEKAISYRDKLAKIVHENYLAALTHKLTDQGTIDGYRNQIIAMMRSAEPNKGVPFQRILIPDAEAEQIYSGLTKPDYAGIFNEFVKTLNDKFALYANDLANAEQAVANQQQTFAAQQAEQSQTDAAEKAAATLYVQATATMLTVPKGMKPLHEATRIVVKGDSKEWVATIMAAFLANFQVAIDKVRTKKENPDYSTLSIERMAAALDAAGVHVENIEYETIKK